MKWRVGEVTVTKIVELEVTGGTRFILPQATYEAVLPIGWLQPDFADERGRLKMSIHALVIETPSRRVIVDICLGNDKENRRIPTWNKLQTSFLADLAAAGYPRETIDTVVCTHLHVDHVGWNTMLVGRSWVPTFPNARYLMGRVEYAHWTQQHALSAEQSSACRLGAGVPSAARMAHLRCARGGHCRRPRGLGDAGLGCGPRRSRRDRSPDLRRDQPRPDPWPYPRSRHHADRLTGRRGADYRRLHAPPLPDRPAGVVLDRRLRSRRSAPYPRSNVDQPGRDANPGHRDAFRSSRA